MYGQAESNIPPQLFQSSGIKFKIFNHLLKIANDHFPNLLKVMINLLIHSICGYKLISIICVDKVVCQNLFYIFISIMKAYVGYIENNVDPD